MSTAAIVIAAKRNRILRTFKQTRAFSPDSAISAQRHGIRTSFIFKKMMSDGIILPAGEDLYYLDVPREEQVSRNRRKTVLIIAIMLSIAGIAAYYFSISR